MMKTNILNFQGDLGEYRILKSNDGKSYTFWSEAFDENGHSIESAYQETVYNYIEGCNVPSRFNGTFPIFELGFGLGLGYQATCDYLSKLANQGSLIFVSCELDEKLVQKSIELNTESQYEFASINHLEKKQIGTVIYYESVKNNHKLIVLVGDIRNTINSLNLIHRDLFFKAIYQDAFSPHKSPTLWTKEWFIQLKEIADKDVILGTYSSSMPVRKALVESGWYIKKVSGFGQKRNSIRANLKDPTDPILIEHLTNIEPFLDSQIKDGVFIKKD